MNEQTQAGAREVIQARLKAILEKLLVGVPGASLRSAEEITSQADFASLGLNSVDFLEFIINVETEFRLDVPDEALANPSMRSLDAWTVYLSTQQASAAELNAPPVPPDGR